MIRTRASTWVAWLLPALLVCACVACRPAGTIAAVILCRGVDADGAPLEVTDTFRPDDMSIYSVVWVENMPRNAQLRVVYIALETLGQTDYIIDDVATRVSGSHTLIFHLDRGHALWPAGRYRVEVYVDDQLLHTAEFRVAPATAERIPAVTPSPPSPLP